MGKITESSSLKDLTQISNTTIIDPASLDDENFRALVCQYENIAHGLFFSRTAVLLKIINEEFSDDEFRDILRDLKKPRDKIALLLALQKARLEEYSSLSFIVKNIATIAELLRKSQTAPTSSEILSATTSDLAIIKLLIQKRRWITNTNKQEILDFVHKIIENNIILFKEKKKTKQKSGINQRKS